LAAPIGRANGPIAQLPFALRSSSPTLTTRICIYFAHATNYKVARCGPNFAKLLELGAAPRPSRTIRNSPAGESAAKPLTNEARRIAANVAKLPELVRKL
jgi:hypothetical protein